MRHYLHHVEIIFNHIILYKYREEKVDSKMHHKNNVSASGAYVALQSCGLANLT